MGAPVIVRDAPHNGELHPDGDELLFVISGHVDVMLEIDGQPQYTELRAGEAFVVPRGTWHKVTRRETSQLLHVTPGPSGDWRL